MLITYWILFIVYGGFALDTIIFYIRHHRHVKLTYMFMAACSVFIAAFAAGQIFK